MLLITLCTAWFSWAKINKKFWLTTLRFGPSTLKALALALLIQKEKTNKTHQNGLFKQYTFLV